MASVEEAQIVEQAPQTGNGGGPTGGEIPVENPATGEIVATVPDLGPEAVAAMAERGRAAQPGWEAYGFEGRGRILLRAQKWLMDNAEQVIATIISETGKTFEDASLAEISYAGNAFGFWAKQAGVPGRRAGQVRTAARQGQEADPALPPARPDRRDRPVELPADELLRRLHPGARPATA